MTAPAGATIAFGSTRGAGTTPTRPAGPAR